MARKRSLRNYDVQAKLSLYISCAALPGLLALAFLVQRNYHGDVQQIVYKSNGTYAILIFLVTALTILLGTVGAAIGANSAGQKRNELGKRSWLAFFIGAGTISLTIILFAVFWFYKLPVK